MPRDSARLLAHRIASDRTEHLEVRALPDQLEPGDLLVLNDTRVVPARLVGRRASGGRAELLLLEPWPQAGSRVWRALVRPAGRVRAGEWIEFETGAVAARMLERVDAADGVPGAEWCVEIDSRAGPGSVLELLERFGRMPLPPYIRRAEHGGPDAELDRARYQTVFARELGAVAAPTAGLHFTPELFERLERRGVRRAFVTLHVGRGTFLPVSTENVEEHRMHAERFTLPEATARAIAEARARGGRVVAVGTTSVRVLESCASGAGGVRAGAGETSIFLRPGDSLRVVDALLTNFHLPRSTLLMLVSAIAGRERVLRLYSEALQRSYRFFSYGDAMLLLP